MILISLYKYKENLNNVYLYKEKLNNGMNSYFNTTNFTEKSAQEKIDFDRAVMVFKDVYSAITGITLEFTPMPENSIPDMRYIVSGETFLRRYVGEIKQRNREYIEGMEFPILVRKYTGLRRKREKGERIFYLAIWRNLWALFDLDRLDLGKCRIDDWYIKDVQYSDCEHRSYHPTIFIPISEAKIIGKCNEWTPIAANNGNSYIN